MRLINKLSYSQFWNIGFCEQSPMELLRDKALNPIRWMKHSYKDRWFADPFILKVTENEIIVLVEECLIESPKGIIAELVVDRRTMHLIRRYAILELDTHLSYPTIYRHNDNIYICPENGQSEKLTMYEYDTINHKLTDPVIILNEAVADATILELDSQYYLFATKYPDTQSNLYQFKSISNSILGPYQQIIDAPVQNSRACSRPAGAFFNIGNNIFRPAQSCVKSYGESLSIMIKNSNDVIYNESLLFNLRPNSFRYNKGLHTLNFYDNYLVIDGYGYQYPIMGRIINYLRTLKHKLLVSK